MVEKELKDKLESMKIIPRESYNSVIQNLIDKNEENDL